MPINVTVVHEQSRARRTLRRQAAECQVKQVQVKRRARDGTFSGGSDVRRVTCDKYVRLLTSQAEWHVPREDAEHLDEQAGVVAFKLLVAAFKLVEAVRAIILSHLVRVGCIGGHQ